jgi:hypothetical protein
MGNACQRGRKAVYGIIGDALNRVVDTLAETETSTFCMFEMKNTAYSPLSQTPFTAHPRRFPMEQNPL